MSENITGIFPKIKNLKDMSDDTHICDDTNFDRITIVKFD